MHGQRRCPLLLKQTTHMRIKYFLLPLTLCCMLWLPDMVIAQGLPMVTVNTGKAGQQYSLTLQLLGLMTVLTLLPSLLLMMTSFVRIIIVLSILRQALGTGQTPPNTVLVGLALFLTVFVMSPVLTLINAAAAYLPEGTGPEVLGFWHPPTGEYLVNNDCLGVIAGCEHPVLAHHYLNHLLDNAVAECEACVEGREVGLGIASRAPDYHGGA